MALILIFIGYLQFYQFYLHTAFLYGLYLIFIDVYGFVQLWETLVVGQYETADCLIFVRLGAVEAEHFVPALHLQPARKKLFVVAECLCCVVGVVVLVFNLSDNLFEKVLK